MVVGLKIPRVKSSEKLKSKAGVARHLNHRECFFSFYKKSLFFHLFLLPFWRIKMYILFCCLFKISDIVVVVITVERVVEQPDSEHTSVKVCDGFQTGQSVIGSLEFYCVGGVWVGGNGGRGRHGLQTLKTYRRRYPLHKAAAFLQTMLNRAINLIRLDGLWSAVIGRYAVAYQWLEIYRS